MMDREGLSSNNGESPGANEVSGPRIKKKNTFKRVLKYSTVIVPELLSQALMSTGPISITAFSVQLVRNHPL